MDSATLYLVLAQDGDDLAFTRLVEETEADIRRFGWWFLKEPNNIDDVVQETFLRAYRSIATFSHQSSARSWLLSIARRACLDAIAAEKKNSALYEDLCVAIQSTHYQESVVEIDSLVLNLPVDFKEAFLLVKVFGFGYDEAAEILHCPRGTVQSRVARARAALAQQLSDTDIQQVS